MEIDIIIFFVEAAAQMKVGKAELKETKSYILHGSGQSPTSSEDLNSLLKGNESAFIPLEDPNDKEEITAKVREQLEKEDKKIDKIYLICYEDRQCFDYLKESLNDYSVELVGKRKNFNLKRYFNTCIQKRIQQRKQEQQNKQENPEKTTRKDTIPTIGTSIKDTKEDTQKNIKKSYKPGSDKTEEEKKQEKDFITLQKEITAEVMNSKSLLVKALSKRLRFHIQYLTQVKLTTKEFYEFVLLVAKTEKNLEWKIERDQILASWNSQQGNKQINKITEDVYKTLKLEIIYYYNLAIFLYNQDKWK